MSVQSKRFHYLKELNQRFHEHHKKTVQTQKQHRNIRHGMTEQSSISKQKTMLLENTHILWSQSNEVYAILLLLYQFVYYHFVLLSVTFDYHTNVFELINSCTVCIKVIYITWREVKAHILDGVQPSQKEILMLLAWTKISKQEQHWLGR